MSKTIQFSGANCERRMADSAQRNFRSLNEEALARLEFRFDIEDVFSTNFTKSGSTKPWREPSPG